MKEKIKLDKYAVYEKGRMYEILVFPFIKNMYVYDRTGGDYDRDGCQIDASREAFTYISYAMAILADDPGNCSTFHAGNQDMESIILLPTIWFCAGRNFSSGVFCGRG